MSVILYSTGESCQRCRVAKKHLEARNIPYVEVDLMRDHEQAVALRAQGFNLAPVIRAEMDGVESFSEGYSPDFIDGLVEVHARAS